MEVIKSIEFIIWLLKNVILWFSIYINLIIHFENRDDPVNIGDYKIASCVLIFFLYLRLIILIF